ncbi:hypothetical protein [Sphingobium chungbukense]|uniref:Uncharacterized protein n=1 Tax=Sphingobium chungbukense TaxID=56193 RepID=A0A0M3ASS4_9SPHN|nr:MULTISPECIES: hypothetical protein [Sphingomonadaceae]KKW93232.1 hypothetical protein YP76_00535 [Sphingobium chungbukense]
MSSEPAQLREGKNGKSFRLKIEFLEATARSGTIPEFIRDMKFLKDLASWEDEERGFTAWTSENVHSENGRYPDLAKRWHDVRQKIDRIIPHKRTGRNLSESKKQEISLRSENKVLMLQNESLLVNVENLRKQLRKALNDLERANKSLRGHGLEIILPTATEI